METICDPCRAIDFRKVLEIPPNESSKVRDPFNPENFHELVLDDGANRFDGPANKDCALCRLLSASLCPCEDEWSEPAVRDQAAQDPYVLKALSFSQNCDWSPEMWKKSKIATFCFQRVVSTAKTMQNLLEEMDMWYVCPKTERQILCSTDTV